MSEKFIQTANDIRKEFEHALQEAHDADSFEQLRINYLGRKGKIASLFSQLGQVSPENRKSAGQALNELKQEVTEAYQNALEQLRASASSVESIDLTLPGELPFLGNHHPLTKVFREITDCFRSMGFSIAQGPEIETEYYNFEALNIPEGHPARDMHDTFYVDQNRQMVMRTHTSPVQIHVMENQQPPIRIIAPGRCYRNDTPDATHSPFFHQVEGLCVDENITMADLKGVILNFAQRMFGSDMKIRFRASFFPFTEPSAEYDFTCLICRGKGCRVCKGTGWIEISGAGMVNPAVFKYVNYDPEKYTGYAFGMGVERIAMLLYGVHDIRMFYENDIRFLQQF